MFQKSLLSIAVLNVVRAEVGGGHGPRVPGHGARGLTRGNTGIVTPPVDNGPRAMILLIIVEVGL